MARVHRPPPPVPAVEQEEDNYGGWSENEFEEIYENTEDPIVDDDSDYEKPDEPLTANKALHPLPAPAAPAIPSIPPRPGFRPVPSPACLMPKPPGSAISPRASPLPFIPVEDEETYEIIEPQSPPIEDDGEVYEEVDERPVQLKQNNFPPIHSLRPLPKPGDGGLRVHPPIPVPDFQQKETPSKKPNQAEIKRAVSPNLPRRDLPLPPSVKPTPPGRVPPIQRPSPQPSPAPSPPPLPDVDDMYSGTDFYADADRDSPPPPPPPGGPPRSTKPLPRPPSECDADEEDDGDKYYVEVPGTKPNPWKAKADRPIPAIPQPQPISSQATPSAFSSGSLSRFPVEKLHAGLARMAETSKKTLEPSKAEPAATDSISSNLLLNAKKQLKSVNRVESLNTPEKPKVLPSVKRAESDSKKRLDAVVKTGDRKVSKISEMANKFEVPKISEMAKKFESYEKQPEKQDVNLIPMFPNSNKEPSANTSANRSTPPVSRIKPPPPVQAEVPIKKPAVPRHETNETLAPPRVPVGPRASPVRNLKDEANIKETKSAAESKSTPNDMRVLPKPPTDELGGLYSYAWYFSAIERSDAEKSILDMQKDGAFLVRKSKRGGDGNPYTLTLLYSSFIYNLHIRRRSDKRYALGTEKPDEHVFSSVEDLISFHRNNPIEVVGDSRKNAVPGKVVLRASPKK